MNEMQKAHYIIFNSGITQYQIGKDVQITQQLVSALRSGKRSLDRASFATIDKLAKYYNHIYE